MQYLYFLRVDYGFAHYELAKEGIPSKYPHFTNRTRTKLVETSRNVKLKVPLQMSFFMLIDQL